MKALAAVAVLLLVTACQPPAEPEFTDADRRAIAEEIQRLSDETMERAGQGDLEGWMAVWSPAADSYFVTEPAVFAQGVQILSTMQETREFFDRSRWNRQSTNFTIRVQRVAVLSPTTAVNVIDGHFSVTDMEGETGPEYPMSMTGAWVKEEGSWKAVHWHQSWSNTPIESGTGG